MTNSDWFKYFFKYFFDQKIVTSQYAFCSLLTSDIKGETYKLSFVLVLFKNHTHLYLTERELRVTNYYFTDILLFKGLNNGIFYSSFPHGTDMLWLLHIFHKKKPCHDASKSSLSFLTVFGSTFYFSLMSSKMFNIFMPSWNFMDFEAVGKYYPLE